MSEVETRFQAALAELDNLEAETKLLVEHLGNGIELTAAYAVIDRYWSGTDATNMKTRLSGPFPKENGEIILSAPFNKKLSDGEDLTNTLAYFEAVFPAIAEKVNEVYDYINAHDLNDQEAIIRLNEFRKEPARFASCIRDGWFDGRQQVAEGNIITWETLRDHQVDEIDNGDYLFMTDYKVEIKKAEEAMFERLYKYDNPNDYRLYDVTSSVERIRASVKLTSLFLDYLKSQIA